MPRPKKVGLGTGSTAAFAVERLGMLLKSGALKDIIAVPTSVRTKEQAEGLGIPLVTLDEESMLDVAIDGADDVDDDLNLVKGGGGALLREKMVEVCAKQFIVIVDESKIGKGLGPAFPIPVEIVPFCSGHTLRKVCALFSPAYPRRNHFPINQKGVGNEPGTVREYVVHVHFGVCNSFGESDAPAGESGLVTVRADCRAAVFGGVPRAAPSRVVVEQQCRRR